MKRLLIITFLIALSFYNCFAQTLTREEKIKQAINDVQKFELNKVDLKKFRRDRSQYRPTPVRPRFHLLPDQNMPDPHSFLKKRDTIDCYAQWFMPTTATTADTALLKDSVYVQYYRDAAYQKTAARRTTGHAFLIAGIIVGGIGVIVGTVVVIVAIANAFDKTAKAFTPNIQ